MAYLVPQGDLSIFAKICMHRMNRMKYQSFCGDKPDLDIKMYCSKVCHALLGLNVIWDTRYTDWRITEFRHVMAEQKYCKSCGTIYGPGNVSCNVRRSLRVLGAFITTAWLPNSISYKFEMQIFNSIAITTTIVIRLNDESSFQVNTISYFAFGIDKVLQNFLPRRNVCYLTRGVMKEVIALVLFITSFHLLALSYCVCSRDVVRC